MGKLKTTTAASGNPDELPAKHGNGEVTGHVVYPDGKPAADIRVVAALQTPFIDELYQNGFLTLTRDEDDMEVATEETRQFFTEQQSLVDISQADGSFHIQGLITAPYNIFITGEPGKFIYYMVGMPRDWTAAAAVDVLGKQDQTVRLSQNIVLTPGVVIYGKVINTDGKPLSGIEVATIGPHRPKSSECVACVITDEEGQYSIRVPPGNVTVYIAGPPIIYSKLKEKIRVTLNGKLVENDSLFKAQCRFQASTEESDIVNFQFLPEVSS